MPRFHVLMFFVAVATAPVGAGNPFQRPSITDLPIPLGNPTYVVLAMQDQLGVAAVPLSAFSGPAFTLIANTNGDELLVPLQLKLGNREFLPDLATAVEALDPAFVGADAVQVPTLADAPEGAVVLEISGKPTMGRRYRTFFVVLTAHVCRREAAAPRGCREMYQNEYHYEFGLPAGSPKASRKSKLARQWEALPEGRMAAMIVEGIGGAVGLINLDFQLRNSRDRSGSVFRHEHPMGNISRMRVVSENAERLVMRWLGDGPLFSVETRIAPP